jgi:hypothetical protein
MFKAAEEALGVLIGEWHCLWEVQALGSPDLGARFLELLEAEMEEMWALGNRNPSIQEKHYLGKITAYNFLDFMCVLNEGLLQDAAAMMMLLPEWVTHPAFRMMEVFLSPEFEVSDVLCGTVISVVCAN